MSDGVLTQDEINALLSGDKISQDLQNSENTGSVETYHLNEFEKDTLGEVGNISMGTAATTLSTLLRNKVSITTPEVTVTTMDKLRGDYPLPYLVIEVKYTEGLYGTNVLIVKQTDAAIIADLMMGGAGNPEEVALDEIKLSAVSEAMNQMMGSATTSLSTMFDMRIDIGPPYVTVVDLGKDTLSLESNYYEMAQIRFKMEIGDLVNSEIMQIIPLESVKSMLKTLMGSSVEESAPDSSWVEPIPETSPQYQEPPRATPKQSKSEDYAQPVAASQWQQQGYEDIPSGIKRGEQYAVQAAHFAPLHQGDVETMPQNIGLIMDVPLDVSVELGKTKKTIKDILDLSPGSIIQLDKMAGEPVDLTVNGKLVAKGEVVVIDESYGIRITTILSPMDRISKLQ